MTYRAGGMKVRVNVDTRLAVEDINRFIRTLRRTDRRAIARPAARLVRKELAGSKFTPEYFKDHYYYKNRFSRSNKKRKQKIANSFGMGRKRIKIIKGNLRKSSMVMQFRQSGLLYVGPRYLRTFTGTTMGGSARQSSGFYARWVIEGSAKGTRPNDYMSRAKDALKNTVQKMLIADWGRALTRIARRSCRRGISTWEKYF